MDERKILIWSGTAKNRRQEPVYLPPALMNMLQEKIIHEYPHGYYLFGKKLLIGPSPWIRNRVSELHSAVIKTLGLNLDHTLYSWKHTGAVAFYYANGKDPYKLMKHLRHTDITTTMNYLRSLGLDYDASIQMPEF